jgi:hypothetical protein
MNNPNRITTAPPIRFSSNRQRKSACPNAVADAPSAMKIVENPNTKQKLSHTAWRLLRSAPVGPVRPAI